jgi:flagellar biosynthesis protein FlhF
MGEAVRMARAEFGPDAFVLQTGKARRPGLLGLLGPNWVAVTAGRDDERHEVVQVKREPVATSDQEIKQSQAAKSPKTGAKPKQKQSKRKSPSAQGRAQTGSQAKKPTKTPDQGRSTQRSLPASGTLPETTTATGAPAAEDKLVELVTQHLLERLRQQEVADRYLDELRPIFYRRLRQGGEAPQQRLFQVLTEQFLPAPPWRFGERPYVVPLVGPTGVGKTTTIAKLAAMHALTLGHKVGLLTVDTYRVAAVEQLRAYADILSLPLAVVYSPQEAPAALERLSDCELVLVDTAGRSPHATAQMEELPAFFAAMGQVHAHLVFSATTRESDLVEVLTSFSAHVPLAGLIATKLDETRTYGCLYNAVRLTGQPIAYTTHGQSVPDDIITADSTRLAGYLVGVEP